MAEHLGVRFVYEESKPVEIATPEASVQLAPERLACIPAPIARELRDALVSGDTEDALLLVERIREHDASLADDLTARVRRYDFDELLRWIEAFDAEAERHEDPSPERAP